MGRFSEVISVGLYAVILERLRGMAPAFPARPLEPNGFLVLGRHLARGHHPTSHVIADVTMVEPNAGIVRQHVRDLRSTGETRLLPTRHLSRQSIYQHRWRFRDTAPRR
jgi:hypothetical protein